MKRRTEINNDDRNADFHVSYENVEVDKNAKGEEEKASIERDKIARNEYSSDHDGSIKGENETEGGSSRSKESNADEGNADEDEGNADADEESAVEDEESAVEDEESAVEDEESAVENEESAVENEKSADEDEESADTDERNSESSTSIRNKESNEDEESTENSESGIPENFSIHGTEVDNEDGVLECFPWITIDWEIDNFFSKTSYKSSPFSFLGKEFCISLKLITSKCTLDDSYEIYMEEISTNSNINAPSELNEKIRIFLRTKFKGESKKPVINKFEYPLKDNPFLIRTELRKYLRYILKSLESELLTFFCEMDTEEQIVQREDICPLDLANFGNLSRDFELFQNSDRGKENSDIRFEWSDRTFYCHKSILYARCGKFLEDLQKATPERFSRDHFRFNVDAFLRYVYSGTFGLISYPELMELYSASFQYEFKALREACVKLMISNLPEDRAHTVFILSDEHNDKEFKQAIVSLLFEKQYRNFWASDHWKNLDNEHPQLACEVSERYKRVMMLVKSEK